MGKFSLTQYELSIAKKLVLQGMLHQDVVNLINIGRKNSINVGRLAGIKERKNVIAASDAEASLFKEKKRQFNLKTGLCPFDDERVVRSREAMLLAIELFNSPQKYFKSHLFAVLSIIAWTYIIQHVLKTKKVDTKRKDGKEKDLMEIIDHPDLKLSKNEKTKHTLHKKHQRCR